MTKSAFPSFKVGGRVIVHLQGRSKARPRKLLGLIYYDVLSVKPTNVEVQVIDNPQAVTLFLVSDRGQPLS